MLEIVGAGMAGLLAANMLHRMQPVIFEKQAELPHNHSAVLRFRTHSVADALGIPFREVVMVKAVVTWNNPVADVLNYSFKLLGQYRSDRSVTAGTQVDKRYVAPPGLIARMAQQIPPNAIKLSHDYQFRKHATLSPVISTIPMPALMTLLEFPDQPQFMHHGGRNIHARIESCDAFVSLTIPDPGNPIARISITGDELIAECIDDNNMRWSTEGVIASCAQLLGIPKEKFHDVIEVQQSYAKILPIDEDLRKNFMFWATDKFGIFSLGRFATWRTGLLLDDLVNDVQKIHGWIGNRYDMARNR
jgi:branched-subunit amino acid transport protein